MPLQPDDFHQKKQLVPADFKSVVPIGTGIGAKSASQIAGTDALLVNTDPKSYEETKAMLLDPRTRADHTVKQQMIRDSIFDDSLGALMGIVSDPETSQEDRFTAAVGAGVGPQITSSTPTLDLLAEESLVADSGESETEAAAAARFSLIDQVRAVNGQKRRISNAINSINLTSDQSLASKAVDVAELFAPLVEWNNTDMLLREAIREHGPDSEQALLMGNQKQQLGDMIESLPISEREAFADAMIDLVQEHSTVLFPDGNDIAALDNLERMLLDGDYSDFDKWFDNATSILDIVGVGALARGAVKTARTVGNADEVIPAGRTPQEVVENPAVNQPEPSIQVVTSDVRPPANPSEAVDKVVRELRLARAEATRTEVSPVAPSQVVKDTNPDMSRKIHEAAMDDVSGKTAEAMYGTSRTEAAANDLLPMPDVRNGAVPNKVEMSATRFDEPQNIRRARLANGNTAVSRTEMERVTARLTEGFRNVEGLNLHSSSLLVKALEDGTTSIRARYSPIDSGFTSVDQAYDNAEFAFRNYGLQRDNFVLLKREGADWVEAGDNLKDGDQYAVALDFNYRFRPEDLDEVDMLTTGNFLTRRLDRFEGQFWASAGQGSLVQNLFDAASVIHPQIVNAAAVAVDRSFGMKKLYVDTFENFTNSYKKLKGDRRLAMTNYINEANFEGIPFSVTDLAARGFNAKEIAALKEWRKANDAMWHATNADMVKNLRGRGFKVVVDKTNDTKLIGRPVSRQAVKGNTVAYDSTKGQLVGTKPSTIDELYENGGEVVKLDQPIDIDGQFVDYVISNNTPTGSYTRSLYDSEVVLSYRDGYYPVMYDANYFITKTVKMADGTESRKVIGTAKNRKEADAATKRLSQAEPDAVFSSRKDKKLKQNIGQLDEDGWALAANSGLSSQKIRGERLKDLGADLHLEGRTNLKDPMEAVANQIHQLSQRVSMRTYLETVKKRWMLNYGEHLELPVNPNTGKVEFPKSASGLRGKDGVNPDLVADARTNFNYITGLENGYINKIDDGYKATLHWVSDQLAEIGFPKMEERALDLSKVSPVNSAKMAAFKLFLAANPIRQAIIQRAQIMMLGAINPRYMTGTLAKDLVNLDLARAGYPVSKKYKELFEEVKDSGVIEAVDAHNLIREDSLRMADLTYSQKARSALSAPLDLTQQVGFGAAEQDNLLASWLAHRDLAIKAGKNIKDQRVKDEILGQSRAYTLNMNKAGEMPYSQNTIGLATQFFSFRHKALLQGLTNKSLTPMERAKVLAYTTAMFGVDATMLGVGYRWATDGMPPSDVKDDLEAGVLDIALNSALTAATGETQAIDWGDLAPVEAYGMGNLLVGFITTDISEFASASPAGSLMFGANPRINNMMSTAGRYFNVIDDYEDPELDTKFSDVVAAGANLFSGYSNIFKARYALETRQKMSSSGSISDEDVTTTEAILAAAGFQTKTETGYRATREIQYGESEFTSDDVQKWYMDLKRHLARRGDRIPEEAELRQRVLSEAWRVFGSDRPKAVQEIVRLIGRDAKDGDYKMFMGILREMGYKTNDDVWNMINALPEGQERTRLTQLMNLKELEDDNG